MKKKTLTIICIVAAVILCLGLLMSVAAMGRDPDSESSGGNIFGDIFDGIVDIFTPDPAPDTEIVAEIYVGDDTVPYMQLTREDVIAKMNADYRYNEDRVDANIFSTGSGESRERGILWKNDVRVEILADIDIGEERLRLETSNGNRLTVNGNGHTISSSDYYETMVCLKTYDEGGIVIMNDLKLHSNGWHVLTSYSPGIILDLNGCELINTHYDPSTYLQSESGLYITDSGQYNINRDTYIEATYGIYSCTGVSDIEINVNDGALIGGGIMVRNGNGVDLLVCGTLKGDAERGNDAFISMLESIADVNLTVNDGKIYGDIATDNVPVIKLESGLLTGELFSVEDDGSMPTVDIGDNFVMSENGEE